MKKDNIVIEINNLKKYYGKIRGVEDVSLKINSGEVYGFIGPNGAGKSTTIRILMGLINKTGGEVFLNGKELDINDVFIKKEIGYLPSEVNLYDDLTVKEILDYHESFYDKNINKRRKELVKLFLLDESKKIEDLSLGNSKKLGIVLALMHSPKILILDEATSGLDPIMQNTFFDLLLEEKKKGTTILYSTHVLSEISKICDRVGFIKEGKIIKEDSVSNLEKENITYLTISSSEISKIKNELDLKIILEEENKIKFINNLSPDILIKKLSKYKIDKLLVEEISIEDLFIEYYK
ncbi:MAG: ABC transporter ATP-binding protein [Firmicutes bacterium]|nr:ABC transporter ATP-binding protein [Bacillota bacterium]